MWLGVARMTMVVWDERFAPTPEQAKLTRRGLKPVPATAVLIGLVLNAIAGWWWADL